MRQLRVRKSGIRGRIEQQQSIWATSEAKTKAFMGQANYWIFMGSALIGILMAGLLFAYGIKRDSLVATVLGAVGVFTIGFLLSFIDMKANPRPSRGFWL